MEKQKQFTMGLEKLKWFLIISAIFLFANSCKNDEKEEGNGLLECVLTIYIEETNLNKQSFIYVSQSNKWTDSTSIVAIQQSKDYPERPSENTKILKGKYNGYTIFYSSLVREEMIGNSIKWDEPSYKTEKPKNLDDVEVFSENALQFTYDMNSKELSSIVKAHPMDKKKIFRKIQNCH